jgi:hypothetical protein
MLDLSKVIATYLSIIINVECRSRVRTLHIMNAMYSLLIGNNRVIDTQSKLNFTFYLNRLSVSAPLKVHILSRYVSSRRVASASKDRNGVSRERRKPSWDDGPVTVSDPRSFIGRGAGSVHGSAGGLFAPNLQSAVSNGGEAFSAFPSSRWAISHSWRQPPSFLMGREGGEGLSDRTGAVVVPDIRLGFACNAVNVPLFTKLMYYQSWCQSSPFIIGRVRGSRRD